MIFHSHKNGVVRKLTIQLIYSGVERCGGVQMLNLPRDVLEKLMVGITTASQDNVPDSRLYLSSVVTTPYEWNAD